MGTVDTVEWACVLCGPCIQNEWASRAMELHQILHSAWTFFCRNYSDDSEGCSCGQLVVGSFIMAVHPLTHHVSCSFLVKYQITPVTQPPYSLDLAPCYFWLFLKLPLKGKRFQTANEIQENTTGQLMVIPTKDFMECFEQWKRCWDNCVRSQGTYFEGTEASLSYVQCFLYLLQ